MFFFFTTAAQSRPSVSLLQQRKENHKPPAGDKDGGRTIKLANFTCVFFFCCAGHCDILLQILFELNFGVAWKRVGAGDIYHSMTTWLRCVKFAWERCGEVCQCHRQYINGQCETFSSLAKEENVRYRTLVNFLQSKRITFAIFERMSLYDPMNKYISMRMK